MRRDEEKAQERLSSAGETAEESTGNKRQKREWVRAGSDCGVHELKRVQCDHCAKPFVIRPRLWPYFFRRRDGTIRWFCGMECMQRTAWKGGASLDDGKRGSPQDDGL